MVIFSNRKKIVVKSTNLEGFLFTIIVATLSVKKMLGAEIMKEIQSHTSNKIFSFLAKQQSDLVLIIRERKVLALKI